MTLADRVVIDRVVAAELTMCPPQRCEAWANACRKVLQDRIPGDVVICGVWRGGLAIIAASILRGSGRRVFLFDTFAGMTAPGPMDGEEAAALYAEHTEWCYAPLAEVRSNLARYGITPEQYVAVSGDVALSLALEAPAKVAAAYLDTDFYESTKAEILALWPRLSAGARMFFDDYGTWPGSRAAVDEQLVATGAQLIMVDNGCRYVVRR